MEGEGEMARRNEGGRVGACCSGVERDGGRGRGLQGARRGRTYRWREGETEDCGAMDTVH